MDEGPGRLHPRAPRALPGREALEQRFAELFYVESVSAPAERGERYFYVRTHKDKEKAILYWREGEQGEERVLLDPNTWNSEDGTVSLGVWVPSWDGRKLAFAHKPNAADEAILHVLDVDTGEWSEVDVIEGAKYASPSWTPDNQAFYYEWLPMDPSIPVAERPGYTELRLHRLGSDPKSDAVVHERTGDPKTFLDGGVSRDGKYLFVYVTRGWSENDVWWKRLGDKDFRLLVKGQGAKYSVDVWKDWFYVLTDEGAPKERVFKVSPKKPERSAWKELVPEDPTAALEGINIVGGHLALAYLKDATTEVRLVDARRPAGARRGAAGRGRGEQPRRPGGRGRGLVRLQLLHAPRRRSTRRPWPPGGWTLWAKVDLPIDPERYARRAGLLPLQGRHAGIHVPRPPQGPEEGRQQPGAALRLRRLQRQHAAVVPLEHLPLAGRRGRVRGAPTCAAAASTARSGTRPGACTASRTSSTTSSRRPSSWCARATPGRRSWPSRAAATAACWWARR